MEVPVFMPLPASYTTEATHNLIQTSQKNVLSYFVSILSVNNCMSVCVFILTVSRAAACVGAAPAADVAAAGVRTTLTPTNPNQ